MPIASRTLHQQRKKRLRGCKVTSKKLNQYSRKSSTQRGYGYRWQKARVAFLSKKENALCWWCRAANKTVAATVVDHITPHKGDMNLFWDEGNWQGLCKHHHDKKTARQDGGFGRGLE